ncbi:MAG: hypothetical protein ACI4D3_07520 [Lachnospiraceae bacterium]
MNMKMIKQKLSLGISLFCLLILVFSLNVFAESPSYKSLWDEEENAYLISSVEELKLFRDSLAEYDYAGEKILLTSDINITKEDDIGTVEWNSEGGSIFQGYFNGQGYKITGFYDTKSGLFNNIGKNGVITKLILDLDVDMDDGIIPVEYAPLANIVYGRVMYCGTTGSINVTVPEDYAIVNAYSSFISCLKVQNTDEQKQPSLISDCYSLVCLAPITSLFHLFKFPSAALSSIAVATATTHSSALQTENLSCMKQFAN